MIIVLNNKSNFTKDEFNNYVLELKKVNTDFSMILCPTFMNIPLVNPNEFVLASQDVSPYEDGAHTGEISARQLKDLGVKYSLVGHSERREFESEEELYLEIKQLFKEDLIPILCIGETKEERDNNLVKEVLNRQLENVVNKLEEQEKLIIAYEPVWSIGTGIIPSNEEIEEVLTYIKSYLPNTKILYGGSVNEENVDTLKEISLVDGYLLGGLSLDPKRLQKFLDKLKY